MVFNLEYLDGITQARLLASFVPALNSSYDAEDAGDASWCATIVSNTNHFQLVAQYLVSRLSFHQVSQVIFDTKDLIVIGSIV